MENLVSLVKLPHFKQTEFEQQMDAVLQLIDEGNGPVVILDNNNSRFLLFSWNDYFSHFGWLYTKAEIEALEQACGKTR